MKVKKELCYYGPQELLYDYKTYGVHRFPFVPQIFDKRFLKMAEYLGSDVVSQKDKKSFIASKDYQKLLSIPPGAYYRKKFYENEKRSYYVVYKNILNKKELALYNEELKQEESDEEDNQWWQEQSSSNIKED